MFTEANFEEMYRDYLAAAQSHCISKAGHVEDGEDLVQDVFMKALELLRGGVEVENPYAWLCDIADKLWANKVRRKRDSDTGEIKELSLDQMVEDYHGNRDTGQLDDEPPQLVDPAQDLDDYMEKQALWEAINELKGKDKKIMLLASEGYTQEEIAEKLGYERSTVTKKIKTISARLKKEIGDE